MSTACFHCGEPVTLATPIPVFIDGVARPMCCTGCAAVASTIAAAGLTDYYRHRSAIPANPVPDFLPGRYDVDGVQARYLRADADGDAAELLLDGLTCPACAWLAERALAAVPGITAARVNYTSARARVTWPRGAASLDAALSALAAVGLAARPFDAAGRALQRAAARRRRLFELAVAALGMMQVMMYAVPAWLAGEGEIDAATRGLMQWAGLILTLPVLAISARSFFRGAFRDLSHGRVGMDVPIALAIAVAFAASAWATVTGTGAVYFDSVSMFVFLLLGARYLEAMARERAVDALERGDTAAPPTAQKLAAWPASRAATTVASAMLAAGDVVRVDAGGTLPADGIVLEGTGALDTAVMTGESTPVRAVPGDDVIAGAVNAGDPLIVRVTRAGDATLLAGIARLTGRALAEKPPVARLVDRIAAHFSALVLVLAAVTALAWWGAGAEVAIAHAVAVLVVTCPCALALATPTALTAATARLATAGVLVTRGHAVEALSRITDIVFDKTGTLTTGEMRVTRVLPMALCEREALSLAAGLEAGSTHPLGQALIAAARDAGVAPAEATHLSHATGLGVEGEVDGARLRLGSAAWVGHKVAVPLAPAPAGSHATRVLLGRAGHWLAGFEIADALRPEAREAVDALRAAGVRVHLVSGDGPQAVSAVADALSLPAERVRAQAMPDEKRRYAARLQAAGRVVAMAGDGVNDAPVLAQADVSLAMAGAAGLARGAADALLTTTRLTAIAEALAAARAGQRVMRQNLAWAIAYNAIAVPLAMLGALAPWVAALGMAASSLLVVGNAARLLRAPR